MPELPEVETIKRELCSAVIGKTVSRVVIYNAKVIRQPRPEQFARALIGATIKNIERKGKLLIFELSNAQALCIHLKMTGQLIYPGGSSNARVRFQFSDGTALDFNDRRLFAELRLVSDWKKLPFVQSLGPEPFDISFAQFKALLAGRKTKIKPLIMDQTILAGIGNLYAAEALFRSRMYPGRSACDIVEKDARTLFEEIKSTLREAIRSKGSSIDQYVQLDGSAGTYNEHHKVYGRDKKPCVVCKTPIARISLGGRGTYYCPKCQK